MDLVELSNNHNRHPWEISRMNNISQICCNVMQELEIVNICDIGSGDRYFINQLLTKLNSIGAKANIFAVDNKYTDLNAASDEITLLDSIETIQKNSMDFVIMMDVLEHVQDDSAFMQAVLKLLKKNGRILITVPAYQSLFSSHDVFLNHYRRYNFKSLCKLVNENKMQIENCHYFYFSLLIVRWLQVKVKRNQTKRTDVGIGMWKYSAYSAITKTFVQILNLDFGLAKLLNRLHVRLPGLSLMCVAKKS